MVDRYFNEDQKKAAEALQRSLTEEMLWECIVAFQHYPFRTVSGLPYQYELKKGRSGKFNKELLIDRREGSKSLTWSSIRTAFLAVVNAGEEKPFMKRPKALGDIRGISYIYPMFYRFDMIRVPENFENEMLGRKAQP